MVFEKERIVNPVFCALSRGPEGPPLATALCRTNLNL